MNDIIQLEGFFVRHHALIEGDQVHLLDGGFIGGIGRIKRYLKTHNLDFENIKSITISHGHLDHTLNITYLKERSGCQVYAPEKDRELIEGHHYYEGLNKAGGFLERIGSTLMKHQPPKVDQWFREDDVLNIFGGLEIITLPGHTSGHCGFLQKDRRLLFANDLFSNHFGIPKPPPRIFNDDHEEAMASIITAAELTLEGVFLNHGKKKTPGDTLQDLNSLASHLKEIHVSSSVTRSRHK